MLENNSSHLNSSTAESTTSMATPMGSSRESWHKDATRRRLVIAKTAKAIFKDDGHSKLVPPGKNEC